MKAKKRRIKRITVESAPKWEVSPGVARPKRRPPNWKRNKVNHQNSADDRSSCRLAAKVMPARSASARSCLPRQQVAGALTASPTGNTLQNDENPATPRTSKAARSKRGDHGREKFCALYQFGKPKRVLSHPIISAADPPARSRHAPGSTSPAPDTSAPPPHTSRTPRCDKKCALPESSSTPKCTPPRRNPS